MTPFQWGPSPPEPESYSATSTGTPAPLSPDVAELVRRVRELDRSETELLKRAEYAEEWCDKFASLAGGVECIGEHSNLNNPWENAYDILRPHAEYERLAAENAKLRAALEPFAFAADILKRFGIPGETCVVKYEDCRQASKALKGTA